MDIQDIRNNLDTLPDDIEKAEHKFLEEKSMLGWLEDMRKPILSQQMKDVMGSVAHREMMALASDEYLIHLNGIREQKDKVAKLEAKFHALQNKFEAMRSLNKNV